MAPMSDGGGDGRELLARVWAQAGCGIVVIDELGRLVAYNPAAAAILGHGRIGESIAGAGRAGIYYLDRKTPIPPSQLAIGRALRGETVTDQVSFISNSVVDGMVVAVAAGPLLDETGRVTGAVAMFRDVSALVEREEFRREATHLLVHDLKNALAVATVNLELVGRAGTFDEEALTDAREAVRRAGALTTDLLDVARLEETRVVPSLVPVDLADLVRGIFERRRAIAREREIELAVEPARDAKVPADPELLARVLENIVANALRYTPRGGVIRARMVDVGARPTLHIGNSGPPVPAEKRAVIFEKNVRLESANGARNYGLGLYFARLVMEAHGGSIAVEATPELPAVFVLSFPPVP